MHAIGGRLYATILRIIFPSSHVLGVTSSKCCLHWQIHSQDHRHFKCLLTKATKQALPGVDSGTAVALPRVVVASVVDNHILIRLGRQDVPVIRVVQILVAVVAQVCRAHVELLHVQAEQSAIGDCSRSMNPHEVVWHE